MLEQTEGVSEEASAVRGPSAAKAMADKQVVVQDPIRMPLQSKGSGAVLAQPVRVDSAKLVPADKRAAVRDAASARLAFAPKAEPRTSPFHFEWRKDPEQTMG